MIELDYARYSSFDFPYGFHDYEIKLPAAANARACQKAVLVWFRTI